MYLVTKKTGDLRPVINLKSPNECVEEIHFKMENIDLVKTLLKPGNYRASIDLKDAYFSTPIWLPYRKYLRFCLELSNVSGRMLSICVQPTNSIFSTFLKPVMAHARYHGVRLIIFINDILIIRHNHQEYLEHDSFLTNLLIDLVFTVNTESSHLEKNSVSDLSRFHRQFSKKRY